jgi:predicted nucleotidyltransferase
MDKYLKLAHDLVLSHIEKDDYAVFLFGSRAAGKSGRGTDIDIGYEKVVAEVNYWTFSLFLYHLKSFFTRFTHL